MVKRTNEPAVAREALLAWNEIHNGETQKGIGRQRLAYVMITGFEMLRQHVVAKDFTGDTLAHALFSFAGDKAKRTAAKTVVRGWFEAEKMMSPDTAGDDKFSTKLLSKDRTALNEACDLAACVISAWKAHDKTKTFPSTPSSGWDSKGGFRVINTTLRPYGKVGKDNLPAKLFGTEELVTLDRSDASTFYVKAKVAAGKKPADKPDTVIHSAEALKAAFKPATGRGARGSNSDTPAPTAAQITAYVEGTGGVVGAALALIKVLKAEDSWKDLGDAGQSKLTDLAQYIDKAKGAYKDKVAANMKAAKSA